MTEPSAIEVVQGVLESHHAYHLGPKGAHKRLRHDDDACEVDDALEALTTLRNQVEQMEGIIERVTFLAEHWDTWAGVLLREALSTTEPENPEMKL